MTKLSNICVILFVCSSIAAALFPILMVSAIGCLVVVVIERSKSEKELVAAKETYLKAVEKVELAGKELRETTEAIEDLQRQIENVKAAQNMNLGRR